jgi:rare lipoprotein A
MSMSENSRWAKSSTALAPGMVLLLLLVLLSGCSSTADKGWAAKDLPDPSSIPDAVPKVEPKSKYGNPASYVVFGKRYHTKSSSKGYVERGVASWYGPDFHGRKTSSGERYDMYAMTAAHKTLPLPTYARVTNLKNGRTAVVKINDRGPFHGDRIIDLSYSAARKLGVVAKGTGMVEVRAVDPSRPESDRKDIFLASDDSMLDAKTPVPKKAVVAKRTPTTRKTTPRAEEIATRVAKVERPQRPLKAAPVPVVEKAMPSTPELKIAVASAEQKHGKSNGSSMYLQVGAFGSRVNAEHLRRQLATQIAEQVEIRATDDVRAHWYKVHVGPLKSKKKAKDLSQQLASLGLPGSHIVVE